MGRGGRSSRIVACDYCHRPNLSWSHSYENQANELQSAVGTLDGSVVAIGHSNGGLVSREWARQHAVSGILTVGTPHQGAPLVGTAYYYANFNTQLLFSLSAAVNSFQNHCCGWSWLFDIVLEASNAASGAANSSLWNILADLGLNAAAPVIPEMFPGSPFLGGINSSGNVSREANEVASRVGIVSIAHNFYWGGPIRAAWPDQADQIAEYRDLALGTLDYYAQYIYTTADLDDHDGFAIADRLSAAAFALSRMDAWWCAAVSDPGMNGCAYNDTVVPLWSQDYATFGAVGIYVGDGPAHTQETRLSDY